MHAALVFAAAAYLGTGRLQVVAELGGAGSSCSSICKYTHAFASHTLGGCWMNAVGVIVTRQGVAASRIAIAAAIAAADFVISSGRLLAACEDRRGQEG
jgi:hypothetical protein